MEETMKNVIGLVLLLVFAGGCVVEEEHSHHGRVAVVEAGHVHGAGCGHILIKGVWYDER
jgi:hypothetical protein